jgi:predicted oxidoreductase
MVNQLDLNDIDAWQRDFIIAEKLNEVIREMNKIRYYHELDTDEILIGNI